MKKALSLILALTLAMALAVPAMAWNMIRYKELETYVTESCEITNVAMIEWEDDMGWSPIRLHTADSTTLTITNSVFDYEGSEYYQFVKFCTIEHFGDDESISESSIEDFEGEKNIRWNENGIMAPGSYCVFQPGTYRITIGGGMESKDHATVASPNSSGWHVGGSSGSGWDTQFFLFVGYIPTVMLTNQNLTVDGEAKNTEIYNIDGSNYFKLRDMAALLNGTGSQFSVDFDSARNTIVVKTGAAYTSVGGELATGTDKSDSAVASAQSVEIDGTKVELTAFNIGGNNFFKLRELGTALGFDVDYDSATATMIVKSK